MEEMVVRADDQFADRINLGQRALFFFQKLLKRHKVAGA